MNDFQERLDELSSAIEEFNSKVRQSSSLTDEGDRSSSNLVIAM